MALQGEVLKIRFAEDWFLLCVVREQRAMGSEKEGLACVFASCR